MGTKVLKKKIGDYIYEIYEIKNLKGIFYNVEIFYQGKRISTNIPVYENNYILSEVEKDVEFHIFTYGMLQDLVTTRPLSPPSPNTPVEVLPLTSKTTSTTKTEGKVIDDNSNQPIKGAKVVINEQSPQDLSIITQPTPPQTSTFLQPTTSNNKGEVTLNIPESTQTFTQSFNFPTSSITSPSSESSTPLPTVTISAPGYETIEKVPYKGDGTAKEDLGIIQMTPIQAATEADKIEASQLKPDQINKLSDSYKTPEYFAQKKLTDLVINLKQTALPLAITLIAQFGITKATQLIDQGKTKSSDLKNKISCPTPEELSKLIQRKNKLTKQLNNALKSIDRATKILGITGNVLTTLEIAFRILKNLPLPSAVPPGVGLPVNIILGIQDSKDKIDKTITKLKVANAGLLTILVIVRQVLTQLLQLLSLLDSLIQECSPDNNETQEIVSNELLALTQQQTQQLSPVITNVNGFEMGVETEPTTNTLKRRRAIARNKSGVVMLKGEWSFSSIDQILIDELIFYIQQNDLKAE